MKHLVLLVVAITAMMIFGHEAVAKVWNEGQVISNMTPEIAGEIGKDGKYEYSPPSVEGAGLELFKITLSQSVNLRGGDVWVRVSEETRMSLHGEQHVPEGATVWFYQLAPASRGGRPEIAD
jgi:hypothetical protein